MKTVLIFGNNFFQVSETFIYRQVIGAGKKFHVVLMTFNFLNLDRFSLSPEIKKIELKVGFDLMDWIYRFFYGKILGRTVRLRPSISKLITAAIRAHKVDVIHAHYGHAGLRILEIARTKNIPLIVSFHGFDASKSTRNAEYMHALPMLFDYASAITVVGRHMIRNLNLDRWMEKVHLVPYGIDVNKYKRSKIRSLEELKILHVGRLVDKKGVLDLIRAFAKLHNKSVQKLSLHIVGDGPEAVECHREVAELKIEEFVNFYGALDESQVIKLMDESHVFVLNSRTARDGDMEGLPNVILEAMSMEMAVVSTYHAAIPDVIGNFVDGLLVPENDLEGLVNALMSVINDRNLRDSLGQNARKKVQDHFTIDIMQSKLNEIYRSV